MQGRVPVVDTDDDLRRRGFGHRVDERPDAVDGREITRWRDARCLLRVDVGVDRVNVVVLVASLVLGVEDEATVFGPEVAADRSLGIRRDGTRRIERLVRALDPDVHHLAVGLAERNPLAVG